MGRHGLIAGVCLYCVAAMATGDNGHLQGVRFAGVGFDEQKPLEKSQWVPRFENHVWPPSLQMNTYKSIDGGTPMKVEAQCDQDPVKDPLFALCSGTVYKMDGGKFVKDATACDPTPPRVLGRRAGAAPSPKTVQLLAIRGKWTNVPGVFERDDNVVTFACAPMIKPKKQWLHEIEPFTGEPTDTRETNLEKSGGLGVLAKCYFWGFAGVGEARTSDTGRLATYQACLRAARAEYCGGGKSHTEWGTIIQVYEPQSTPTGKPKVTLEPQYCKQAKIKHPGSKQPLDFQPCFEALWDTKKALCISHTR